MGTYRSMFLISLKSNIKAIVYIVLFLLFTFIIGKTLFKNYISIENVNMYKGVIRVFVAENPVFSITAYVLGFILLAAMTPPAYVTLTIISGIIFGPILGTVIAGVSAGVASPVTFIVSRYVLKNWIKVKYAKNLDKLNTKIRKSGSSYFFKIRLIPGVPFFLLNLLAGVTDVPLKEFTRATFLGNIPITAAYCYIGYEIEKINGKHIPSINQAVRIFLFSMLVRAVVTIGVLILRVIILRIGKRRRFGKIFEKFKIE